MFDDYYFGKELFEKNGELVRDELGGQIISKRVVDADKPCGLRYNAEKVWMDLYDLLGTLEGMCHNGWATEIDDSHYIVHAAK